MDRNQNLIVELPTRTVGFRIDNWVFRETQRKAGYKGILDLFFRLGLENGNIDVIGLNIFIMEAHNEYLHYTKSKEEPIDERGTSYLIDEMGGMLEALGKISQGLETYIPKNSEAPLAGANSQ